MNQNQGQAGQDEKSLIKDAASYQLNQVINVLLLPPPNLTQFVSMLLKDYTQDQQVLNLMSLAVRECPSYKQDVNYEGEYKKLKEKNDQLLQQCYQLIKCKEELQQRVQTLELYVRYRYYEYVQSAASTEQQYLPYQDAQQLLSTFHKLQQTTKDTTQVTNQNIPNPNQNQMNSALLRQYKNLQSNVIQSSQMQTQDHTKDKQLINHIEYQTPLKQPVNKIEKESLLTNQNLLQKTLINSKESTIQLNKFQTDNNQTLKYFQQKYPSTNEFDSSNKSQTSTLPNLIQNFILQSNKQPQNSNSMKPSPFTNDFDRNIMQTNQQQQYLQNDGSQGIQSNIPQDTNTQLLNLVSKLITDKYLIDNLISNIQNNQHLLDQ